MKHFLNSLTPRGWFVLWILSIIALIAITSTLGVWDTPESCLVDGIACPKGYPAP